MHSTKVNFVKQAVKVARTTVMAASRTAQVNGAIVQSTPMMSSPDCGMMNLKYSVPRRFFGSMPDHLKLQMPNLSPTMEKVS
jgi:hypothetical protein